MSNDKTLRELAEPSAYRWRHIADTSWEYRLHDPEWPSYTHTVTEPLYSEAAILTLIDERDALRKVLGEYVCDCTGECSAEVYGGPCGRAAFAALRSGGKS